MHLILVEYVAHPFNIVRDGSLHHFVSILLAILGSELQLGCECVMDLLSANAAVILSIATIVKIIFFIFLPFLFFTRGSVFICYPVCPYFNTKNVI